MNLVSIFSKSHSIAGIEVSDTHIRLVSFFKRKLGNEPLQIRRLGEVNLSQGVIIGSALRKPEDFTKALQKLIDISKFRGNYAIASIPSTEIYSKIFSFPQTVTGQKLEDAMNIISEYQSPLPRESSYSDWEPLPSKDENETMFMVAPKSLTDAYVSAFQNAGIKLVALETHAQSLCRSIAVKPEDAVIFSEVQATSTTLCIIKRCSIRACHTLHKSLSQKELTEEMRRLRDAYETGSDRLVAAIDLNRAPLLSPFAKDPRIKKQPGTWAIALGAAIRGALPRNNDAHVSLLPVGTEEAYEFQRASVVAEFLSTVTAAIAIFFAITFVGAWAFMGRIQSMVNRQLASSLSLVPPTDAAALEERARNFNALARTAADLIRTETRWNVVLGELTTRVVPGITISNMSLPSPEQTMTMTGLAASRASLVALRKSFDESELFTDIQLPLTNLELRERIPFTLSFKLRDPSKAYPQ